MILMEREGENQNESKNDYHFNPDCFGFCHPDPEYTNCGGADIFLESRHVTDHLDRFYADRGIWYRLFGGEDTKEMILPSLKS